MQRYLDASNTPAGRDCMVFRERGQGFEGIIQNFHKSE